MKLTTWVTILFGVCGSLLIAACSNDQQAQIEADNQTENSLSAEEVSEKLIARENAIIKSEFGILPADLHGWSNEQIIEKLGEPDNTWDGLFAPSGPHDEKVPPKYQAGTFSTMLYTREPGRLYILIYTEDGQTTCVNTQWLEKGSEF